MSMDAVYEMPIGYEGEGSRGAGVAKHGTDANLYVEFGYKSNYRAFRSEKEKRPIYEDDLYIKIIKPGDKSIVHRKATELDKKRFAHQYAAFQQDGKQALVGTPLEKWPGLSESELHTLKHLSIFTIEQLAALSDQDCVALGADGQRLRQEAAAFAAIIRDRDLVEKQTQIIESLTSRINKLEKAEVKDTQDLIEAVETPKKVRRGRPKKIKEVETYEEDSISITA